MIPDHNKANVHLWSCLCGKQQINQGVNEHKLLHCFAVSPTLQYNGASASFTLSKVQQLSEIVNKRESSLLNSQNSKKSPDCLPFRAEWNRQLAGMRNKKQTLNRGMFACARYSAVNSAGRMARSECFPELWTELSWCHHSVPSTVWLRLPAVTGKFLYRQAKFPNTQPHVKLVVLQTPWISVSGRSDHPQATSTPPEGE